MPRPEIQRHIVGKNIIDPDLVVENKLVADAVSDLISFDEIITFCIFIDRHETHIVAKVRKVQVEKDKQFIAGPDPRRKIHGKTMPPFGFKIAEKNIRVISHGFPVIRGYK